MSYANILRTSFSELRPVHGLLVVLLLTAATPRPAGAVLCALDEVPAATLLIPYFEVDLESCGELNTVVTILNTVPENTIAHITLWTDWGAPSIDFDIYLTGYDRLDFDLAAAFCNGSLPVTGPTVSNHGSLSDPPGATTTCDLIFPYTDPIIPPSLLDRMAAFHTGQQNPATGECHGFDHGDNIARGWVTIDVVRDCSTEFPSDLGYFEAIAGFENRLMGEAVYIDSVSGEVMLLPAIHLESDIDEPRFAPGDHTFYGSINVGNPGAAVDRREPIPTTYIARTAVGETSELIVWREAFSTHHPSEGAECGTAMPGFPLAQNPIFAFDEEENPALVLSSTPLMTQRTPLALPDGNGWLRFDGRHAGAQAVYGDDLAQAWVGKLIRLGANGQRLTGQAYPVDSTCEP